MSDAQDTLRCPHCNTELSVIALPQGSGWEESPQRVCFNDDCSYYREGWDWIWEKYSAKASYRYRLLDPETGIASPLAVWSDTAIRDRIIKNE
jgi:hypothetical protein